MFRAFSRWGQQGPIYRAVLAVGGILASHLTEACPAALFGHDLLPQIMAKRQELAIYSGKNSEFGKSSNQGNDKRVGLAVKELPVNWKSIPLQVDLIDQQGHIDFSARDFMKDATKLSDLIMFRTESFGDKIDLKKNKLPCQAGTIFELKDSESDKYAYLTHCLDKSFVQSFPHSVSFSKEKSSLQTRHYLYEFNNENYMQFDNIFLKRSSQSLEKVALNSKLVITSDVKNFFTLHFDSKQIESKLENSRLGPIANLARLSFFLRILFFKLDMSLSTDVAFFEDSGHIPMMINLPVDSFKYLNPKSGILYTWIVPKEIKHNTIKTRMPTIDVEKISEGWKNLGPSGLAYCRSAMCQYSFRVETDEKTLIMKMEIKRSLVERGFFPQYVGDVSQFKEAMDWEIDLEPGTKRLGMYFEFSGLPKGGHPWSFWLKMNDKNTSVTNCPVPVDVRTVSQG